jgi:hypothetical protein
MKMNGEIDMSTLYTSSHQPTRVYAELCQASDRLVAAGKAVTPGSLTADVRQKLGIASCEVFAAAKEFAAAKVGEDPSIAALRRLVFDTVTGPNAYPGMAVFLSDPGLWSVIAGVEALIERSTELVQMKRRMIPLGENGADMVDFITDAQQPLHRRAAKILEAVGDPPALRRPLTREVKSLQQEKA